jgi:hypothetical protein
MIDGLHAHRILFFFYLFPFAWCVIFNPAALSHSAHINHTSERAVASLTAGCFLNQNHYKIRHTPQYANLKAEKKRYKQAVIQRERQDKNQRPNVVRAWISHAVRYQGRDNRGDKVQPIRPLRKPAAPHPGNRSPKKGAMDGLFKVVRKKQGHFQRPVNLDCAPVLLLH